MAAPAFGDPGFCSGQESGGEGFPRILHCAEHQRRRCARRRSPLPEPLLGRFLGDSQRAPGLHRGAAQVGAYAAGTHGANCPFRGVPPAGIEIFQAASAQFEPKESCFSDVKMFSPLPRGEDALSAAGKRSIPGRADSA